MTDIPLLLDEIVTYLLSITDTKSDNELYEYAYGYIENKCNGMTESKKVLIANSSITAYKKETV